MTEFDEAIGQWEFTIGGREITLEPTVDDFKQYRRRVMLDSQNMKDKNAMFDRFAVFIKGLIKRTNPEATDEGIEIYIEKNISDLFNEAMIFFRWTTKEKLAEAEKQGVEEVKKAMSSG